MSITAHKEISPENGTQFKRTCSICGTEFVAVFPVDNLKIGPQYGSFCGQESVLAPRRFLPGTCWMQQNYVDVHQQIVAVCPNCKGSEVIGYMTTARGLKDGSPFIYRDSEC